MSDIISTGLGAVMGVTNILGTAAVGMATNQTYRDTTAKSLSSYSTELQLRPTFAIESELLHIDEMQKLIDTGVANYAGYYIIALSVDNTVNNVSVGKLLGKYNPNRDAVADTVDILGSRVAMVSTSSYKPCLNEGKNVNLSISNGKGIPNNIPDLPKNYLNLSVEGFNKNRNSRRREPYIDLDNLPDDDEDDVDVIRVTASTSQDDPIPDDDEDDVDVIRVTASTSQDDPIPDDGNKNKNRNKNRKNNNNGGNGGNGGNGDNGDNGDNGGDWNISVNGRFIDEFNKLSNLASGTILKVSVSRDKVSANVDILLKPELKSIKSKMLVEIASISKKPITMRERWIAFWSRETIHSTWDYLTCRDLAEAHRRNLVEDTTGYYEKIHNQKVNNSIASLLTGNFSVGTIANTWIISEQTFLNIQAAIGSKFTTNKRARNKFMEESGCMTMIVYNSDFQRIFIFNHGIDDFSEISLSYLDKKQKDKNFFFNIFKMLSSGNAPII